MAKRLIKPAPPEVQAAYFAVFNKLRALLWDLTRIEDDAFLAEHDAALVKLFGHPPTVDELAAAPRGANGTVLNNPPGEERIMRLRQLRDYIGEALSAMRAMEANHAADRERRRRQQQTAQGARIKHERSANAYAVVAAAINKRWPERLPDMTPGWITRQIEGEVKAGLDRINVELKKPIKLMPRTIESYVRRVQREARGKS